MIASGLLSIGAVGMFGGIAWLLHSYEGKNPALAMLSLRISYCMQALVVLMLTITARGFIRDLYITRDQSPPWWLAWSVGLYAPAMLLTIVLVVTWWKPADEAARERAANRAAYASVLYVTLSVIVYGLAAGFPRPYWMPMASWWPVGPALGTSLILPAAALIAHVRALPRYEPGKARSRD